MPEPGLRFTGGEATLRSLPEDVADHVASSCSKTDGFAYRVATRRHVKKLRISTWGRQATCLVHDPWTRRLAGPDLDFEEAPLHVLQILPSFEFVTDLTLRNQNSVVSLGNVYPPQLRWLSLHNCRVSAGDADLSKALENLLMWECRVILGPEGRQWPLLSSSDSAISRLLLERCILQDQANADGLPLTCPKIRSLSLKSCVFLSRCLKPNLFYGVPPTLRQGTLAVDASQMHDTMRNSK